MNNLLVKRRSNNNSSSGSVVRSEESTASPSTGATCSRSFFGRNATSAAERRIPRAVLIGRFLLLGCLLAAAAGLGYAAYHYLKSAEDDLAATQFQSIADRALTEAVDVVRQRVKSALTMASVVAEMNPDAAEWPFVSVTGFETIVRNLLEASSGKDMGFIPIVRSDQVPAFEEFARQYYATSERPAYSNRTGVSSFGFGVWALNKFLDTIDQRYHDNGQTTTYGSDRRLVTPVFHTSGGGTLLLYNTHSDSVRGRANDDLMQCAEKRAADSDPSRNCGVVTDFVTMNKHSVGKPAALLYQPIYPANDPLNVSHCNHIL